MRKILFILTIMAMLACPAMAARYRQHQVEIVDEFGDAVTNIDIITIIDAGTSTNSTIFSDRAGDNSMTNPITTSSDNSTFQQSLGLVTWFQAAPDYKITVTESGESKSLTIDNQAEGDTRFPFYENYIGAAATLTVGDDNLLNIGTSADFTHDWDNGNTKYVISSAADAGRMDIGKAGTHTDVYWHTGVAITDDYVLFDEGSANVFFKDVDLVLDSSAVLFFGDSSDMSINYDESTNDLDILSTSALDEISFGANTDGFDVIWHGNTAATNALFDYSADELLLTLADLKISQGSQIEFSDSGGVTTVDWTIDNATNETLLFTPTETSDDQTINFGNATNTTDFRLFGKDATTVVWDASEDGLTISGGASQVEMMVTLDGATLDWVGADDVGQLVISAGSTAAADAGAAQLLITNTSTPISAAQGFMARFVHTGSAQSNSAAVSIEVPATQPALKTTGIVVLNGQDAAGAALLQVIAVGASGNADAMTITNTGTGDNLQATVGSATGVGINVIAAASQTTSLAKFDGATGSWIGADDVGMIHVTADSGSTLAHVDSSLLRISNSAVPQNDSRGSSLRIVDTGDAAAGTAGYAVYISATDATVEAMYIDDGDVLIDDNLDVGGTITGQLVTEIVTADGTLTADASDPSGKVFVIYGPAAVEDITITLPSMAATEDGWTYTFVDANATSVADVSLVSVDSDTIQSSANDFSSSGADELGSVTIMYLHSTIDWVVISNDELDDGDPLWITE